MLSSCNLNTAPNTLANQTELHNIQQLYSTKLCVQDHNRRASSTINNRTSDPFNY